MCGNQIRGKIEAVRRNKLELCLPDSVGESVGDYGMKMTVITAFYTIFLKNVADFFAAYTAVSGRVM